MAAPSPALRVDKWLWYARFFKTRGLSAKMANGGHVRVNSNRISKASYGVSVGDTLTFAQGDNIRVVKVLALGTRRGPAPEAQALYDDLAPPQPRAKQPDKPSAGPPPSKKERRSAAKLNRDGLE